MSPSKRQKAKPPARKRARPKEPPKLTLDVLSDMKPESFDIGPVPGSGNPAPMARRGGI